MSGEVGGESEVCERGLSLTVEDVMRIADTVDSLRVAKLRVRGELEVAGHLVAVRWVDDQREGSWPVIVGIRRA